MDKAYRFYLSVSNKILAGVLTLLGFSITSCGADDEYGSPYATYEIKGKVVSEEGNAIPNIQIIIPAPDAIDDGNMYIHRDTILTDSSGDFQTQLSDSYFSVDYTIKIATKDIDGEANGGLFEEKTTEVAFNRDDLKGASGYWYLGHATKKVTITMKQVSKNQN